MARIRTIKPEFFTSEDIVALSPLARLLYIAIWCEADKEGRLQWRPKTLKMRYLPGDNCDIGELCHELVDSGLVVLYGDGLAYIPAFYRHQHINPRESASTLPDPADSPPETTREPRVDDASARVHAPSLTRREEGKGREGKGREGKGVDDASTTRSSADASATRGSRLAADWALPKAWGDWALDDRPGWTHDTVRLESAKFADFWHAKAGKDATKADWFATWRNWCRNARPANGRPSATAVSADERNRQAMELLGFHGADASDPNVIEG